MKTKLLLTTVSACFLLHSAFGQGALTPPGAPAPTMKTLTQIEPRTPIATAPFTISIPGSYYLTTNVTVSSGNAITIAANGVTLDLNGFTISSTAASAAGYGIYLNSCRNVTISNGHIQGGVTNSGSAVFTGSGFDTGISFSGITPNVLISKVSISGCLSYGIFLNSDVSIVVESCTVQTVGLSGISASTIKGCEAADCGGIAIIGNQISDCRGASVGVGGIGIFAHGFTTDNGQAQNCYGSSTGSGAGLAASTALNCVGYNTGGGTALSAHTAQNCFGWNYGGTGAGLLAYTAQNCSGFSSGTNYGLVVGYSGQNCFALSTGGSGFNVYDGGTLISCQANTCATGITAGNRCTIKDCTASNNSTNGIVAGQSCLISGCTVSGNGTATVGIGITVGTRSTIQDCSANDNRSDGILAATDCTVLNNHASHNGVGTIIAAGNPNAAGIHTSGTGSRIDGNHTRDNSGYGVKSDGGAGADTITRNNSGGNGTQYSPSTGTTFAPVQSPATATSPWANF